MKIELNNSSDELTQYPISPDVIVKMPKQQQKTLNSRLSISTSNKNISITDTNLAKKQFSPNQEESSGPSGLFFFPFQSFPCSSNALNEANNLINQNYSLLLPGTVSSKEKLNNNLTSSSINNSNSNNNNNNAAKRESNNSHNNSSDKINNIDSSSSSNNSNNSSMNSNNSSSNLNS
jgi:hypothetical protein